MKIVEAGNTYNVALHILTENQYIISIGEDSKGDVVYKAKKNNLELSSNDPLSLLGITYIPNSISESWLKSEYIDDRILLAINLLIKQGYSLFISDEYSDNWYDWIAKRSKNELIAQTPLKLLGLSIIIERYGENWRSQNIPNYHTK